MSMTLILMFLIVLHANMKSKKAEPVVPLEPVANKTEAPLNVSDSEQIEVKTPVNIVYPI